MCVSTVQFVAAENICVFQFHIEGNLEPLVEISQTVMNEALSHIVDQRNYPILVHCQKGNHRTGCLVGASRRSLRAVQSVRLLPLPCTGLSAGCLLVCCVSCGPAAS